jgi:pyridoxamine 5'-phosphate oxidase family protein
MDIRGHDLANTKTFRDIARYGRAALVVDDLASTKPWRPRGI